MCCWERILSLSDRGKNKLFLFLTESYCPSLKPGLAFC